MCCPIVACNEIVTCICTLHGAVVLDPGTSGNVSLLFAVVTEIVSDRSTETAGVVNSCAFGPPGPILHDAYDILLTSCGLDLGSFSTEGKQ
jgi:hypothetical protein